MIKVARLSFLAPIPLILVNVYCLVSVPQAPQVDYQSQVAPILKAHCVSCHTANNPAGQLDLTDGRKLSKSEVIVPGSPDKSELMARILGTGGKPRMPMGFAPLSTQQIETIRSWIKAGAPITSSKRVHWAYQVPVSPMVPKVSSPTWVHNPIDAFVLARLDASRLRPSAAASKEILLRRVSLDLTGLPPTLEEVDRFLADKSPNAYEKVVDRLFASPHYGERQARIWLDLARYADTHGYEADRTRQAWLYRDWVIEAFNRNMPFDRFTVEQLAGDLIPSATKDQLIATGFHRNSMFSEEGGVDPRESMYETILDRVNTTSTVWMGSTLACARCHDHKFDPFTQKDYYQMYAFFSNNEYRVVGDASVGQLRFYEPTLSVVTPEQQAQIDSLRRELKDIDAKITTGALSGFDQWQSQIASLRYVSLDQVSVQSQAGGSFAKQPDGSFLLTGKVPDTDTYTVSGSLPAGNWTGLRLRTLPDSSFVGTTSGPSSSGNFILSKLGVLVNGQPVRISDQRVDYIQGGYALAGLSDALPDTGWAIYPEQGKAHDLVLAFNPPLTGGQLRLEITMNSPTWPKHLIGRFKVDLMDTPNPTQFAIGATPLTDTVPLQKLYVQANPSLDKLRVRKSAIEARLQLLDSQVPQALVIRDKTTSGPLKAAIHIRGEFLQSGDPVTAGVPGFLSQKYKVSPGNRLGLAKWLVSAKNPLTARVQVNRMWAQYFGRGLVETEEDFGTQGSKPTHPELLDWLAAQFVKERWDMKAIHRLIVTSSTYRQSSAATASLIARDPNNALLARGPRFRMEPEMLRDTALSVAGLLNNKIGGPSVMPYQPPGVWDSPYSGERWTNAQSEDKWRRGLYVFWKRTSPYPAFTAFDASSRETCTVRRSRTNTPLQALTLLNDPAYLEAAKGLGKRMMSRDTDAARVAVGFRLATCRAPTPTEVARLTKLAGQLRARYREDLGAAKALGGSLEGAVWMMVGNVLLNLDETITKS